MGATLEGYASDMTRVLFLGRPDNRIKRIYNAVLEAQLAAIAAVRPGVTAAQVDRAARNVLKTEKLDNAFVHSTGHGLGLEIRTAAPGEGEDPSAGGHGYYHRARCIP
jgi:Xaa-Pro aminopeptidase